MGNSGTVPPANASPDARLAAVREQAAAEQGVLDDPGVEQSVSESSEWAAPSVGGLVALGTGGALGAAIFGAGFAGAWAGTKLAEALGASDAVADAVEATGFLGLTRIGVGDPHPATKDHQVAHSTGMMGFLGAIVAGVVAAAVAVAVVVAVIGTGGVAAVLIGAAVAGGAGGFVGSAVGGAMAKMGSRTGPIVTGSPDVYIEGKAAARMTDTALCSKEYGAPSPIVEGSQTIFVNGLPMVRVGHKLLCGAVVDQGAGSVFIDTTTAACAQPASDVPWWVGVGALWIGSLLGGLGAGKLANQTRSAMASGKAGCNTTCASDPVDVASGAFVEWRTDVAIAGVLPVELRRRYNSQSAATGGLFGPRWCDSWSVHLRRESEQADSIDYHDDEGVVLTFDTPHQALAAAHLRAPELMLRGSRSAPVLHDNETGVQRRFEWATASHARLAALVDASGNRCDFGYDADGARLQTLRHSDGWRLELQWKPEPEQPAAPRADALVGIWLHEPDRAPVELVRYAGDEAGRLTHSASLHSGQLRYAYDERHRIVGWGDASDTRVRLQYDADDRVAEVRTSGAEMHSGRFAYHPELRLTEVWTLLPNGDAEPRLGDKRSYRYNEDGLVTREKDALGRETATEWDRHHRLTATVDALGRRTTYRCGETGLLERVLFADGRSARFGRDGQERLNEVVDASGRKRRIEYDTAGRVVARTVGTLRWQYSHDAGGRLTEETAPDGTTQRQHWDAQHRRCGHTAANGGHTAWRQDRLGRLDWLTDAGGATTTYAYDDASLPRAGGHTQPVRVTRADGSSEQFGYDAEGLLQTYTDAAGHEQHWQWGAYDLLASHTDALGHRTAWHWGSEGRLAELVNAAGQRWRWRYDAVGQCIEQLDYAGRKTQWQHDAAGRVLQRRAADGATLTYAWDSADRLLAVHARDADGDDKLHLSYRHDAQDNLICARVWQLGRDASRLQSELRRTYDEQGRLQEETHIDDSGQRRRIAWRHDAAGRIVARDAALGETTYGLDALGLLAQWHSAHGELQLHRDALGREIERRGLAPGAAELAGAARAAGLPAAAGFVLQQRRDKLGRLLLQQQLRGRPGALDAPWPQSPSAPPGPGEFADPLDPLDALHGDASVQRRYHWHADRLVGIDDAHFGRVRWQLDARDQIRQATFAPAYASVGVPGEQLREHPGSSAVAAPSSVRSEAQRQRFDYDAVGNLAQQDGIALRYQGDTVVSHGALRYHWDACGRLISRTEQRAGWRLRAWQYEWDPLDRLVAVQTPDGQRWRYLYDAFGRRRAKRCEAAGSAGAGPRGQNTATALVSRLRGRPATPRPLRRADYLWDGATLAAQWKVYADGSSEQPADGGEGDDATWTEEVQEWHFEPGGFRPLAVVQQRPGQAARLLHVVADLNAAPRELIDNQGQLVWAGQLDTWGRLQRALVHDRGALPTDQRHHYGGSWRPAANDPEIDIDLRQANQWADEESGLLYNLNRHYDPDLGQYASQDPLGPVEGGLRTHGYVHNPVTWVDPLGLNECADAARSLPQMRGMGAAERQSTLRKAGFARTRVSNSAAKNETWAHPDGSEVRVHPYGNQNATPYKSGNNAHLHKQDSLGQQLADRGHVSTNPNDTHIGLPNPSSFSSVRGRPNGS